MRNMKLAALVWNGVLVALLAFVFYDATHYEGNHWRLFATNTERFLMDHGNLAIWLASVPNLTFFAIFAYGRRFVAAAAVLVALALALMVGPVAIDLAVD